MYDDTDGARPHPGVIAVLLLLLGSLVGCVSKPVKPDPAYAATLPRSEPPAPAQPGAIYRAGAGLDLFADRRARRVGDVLTIVLAENTTANSQANTETSKENNVTIDNPTLFGKQLPQKGLDFTLDQELQSEQSFTGEGKSVQSNTLAGTISVTVAEVLANGALVVRGEKLLTLNQGNEFVRIAGIVRPEDIAPDNTVLSTKLANVRIHYGGKGAIADANGNGWLGRFFQSLWWPF